MNPNSYFEDDPWTHIVAEVRGGSVGRVVAVEVQAICMPDQLDQTLQGWRSHLELLLGPPVDSELLRNEQARSLLLRYEGPVLGRVFIDGCGGPSLSNVEIVGTDGLLVWKPDVRPLAFIISSAGAELSAEHAYAVALQEDTK